MLRIREMQRGDIPFAVQISDEEKWGIPPRDFERILRLDPRGGFIATDGRKRIGLTTTTRYGREIGWIGNVVVEKQFRGKHVGQSLVTHATHYLQKKHLKHIALYCFDENINFYRKLGFLEGTPFARLQCMANRVSTHPPENNLSKALSLAEISALDQKAFGADRSRLVRDYIRSKVAYVVVVARSRARSYMLLRDYEEMCEIGPWISFGATGKELDLMVRESTIRAGERPIEVSVSQRNVRAVGLFKRHGFRLVRTGTSMYFEKIPRIGSPAAILALGFLDKG